MLKLWNKIKVKSLLLNTILRYMYITIHTFWLYFVSGDSGNYLLFVVAVHVCHILANTILILMFCSIKYRSLNRRQEKIEMAIIAMNNINLRVPWIHTRGEIHCHTRETRPSHTRWIWQWSHSREVRTLGLILSTLFWNCNISINEDI